VPKPINLRRRRPVHPAEHAGEHAIRPPHYPESKINRRKNPRITWRIGWCADYLGWVTRRCCPRHEAGWRRWPNAVQKFRPESAGSRPDSATHGFRVDERTSGARFRGRATPNLNLHSGGGDGLSLSRGTRWRRCGRCGEIGGGGTAGRPGLLYGAGEVRGRSAARRSRGGRCGEDFALGCEGEVGVGVRVTRKFRVG
jgi:hypothetical protein